MGYFVPCRTVLDVERTSRSTARIRQDRRPITADRTTLAVMPEIDHRIGKGPECFVQPAETIKAKQEPPEFVFPSKHPFDRLKSFLKYRRVKQRLAASPGLLSAAHIRVDVGDHAAIEYGFAVGPTVVGAI